MRLAELDYPLPEALIAQAPAPERVAARLLVLDRGGAPLRHARVNDLPGFLRAGDVLVVNDTRVIPARGSGRRPSGRPPGLPVRASLGGGRRGEGLPRHVGPGTFLPIRTDDLDHHVMAPEPSAIPPSTVEAIEAARARGGRVVAVGTTTVRALESAWADGAVRAGPGAAALFIRPGHRFRVVDALLTNFHLPRSTLLALVAAFAGWDRIRAAYAEAVRLGYRFYSYGDAMLIT